MWHCEMLKKAARALQVLRSVRLRFVSKVAIHVRLLQKDEEAGMSV